MSLCFPYTPLPVANPIWPLGGRLDRPKALIQVSIVGPLNTVARQGLLDTGADDTAFPEAVAALIGIDLTAAPVRATRWGRWGLHHRSLRPGRTPDHGWGRIP